MNITDPLRVVLDTDTFNEVDDQFALAHLCLSKDKIQFEACYAAPFFNGRSTGPADGMEKSFHEIHRVLDLLGDNLGGHVYRGAHAYIGSAGKPVESDAVRDMISRALDTTKSGPLYIIGIAAATNLASALLLAPEIKNRVHMIWLGGHPLYWPTAHEFNLQQDVRAAQILFDSGVPLTLVPCKNVAEHLRCTTADLRAALPADNKLCAFLQDRFDWYLEQKKIVSKPLWDVVATARLVHPEWVPVETVPSPILTEDKHWQVASQPRHNIAVATDINRDAIFADLCSKLSAADYANKTKPHNF